MAILTSGAHGIAGAVNTEAESDIFSFKFATVSSGVAFIQKSVTANFQFFGTWYVNPCLSFSLPPSQTYKAIPNIRFGERPDALSGHAIGRFSSDMLFHPTRLNELAVDQKPDLSPAIVDAEKTLLSFNEASFNKAFGAVFAKMLLIGTSAQLTPFSDGSTTC